MTVVSAVAMSPVRTWNDINKILDSIDWREFFDMIDGNNQFQDLGRSLKINWKNYCRNTNDSNKRTNNFFPMKNHYQSPMTILYLMFTVNNTLPNHHTFIQLS